MELVAGCYEQVLFGFALRPEQAAWTPVADFTHHAHTASLSAVAVSGRFVVTGSKDETIHIYDMKKKLDHGALVHHSGTITCLKFHRNRHLVSGAEDGLICVWDAKKWECLKSLRAHKGQVTYLSVHPSGKLALSVGTDKTLRTWNLVEGRSAFIKNIKQNAHIVEWSPSGEKYVVVVFNRIDVYQLTTASVSGTIEAGRRVSAVAFLAESVLAVAGDEETVKVFDCDSMLCLCEWKAHENRVKDLCSLEVRGQRVVVTASNDGFIKVWQFEPDMRTPPSLLCQVSTGARLTCVGVWLDGTASSPEHKEQPAVCPEEKEEDGQEQRSKPSRKKQTREVLHGDRLVAAKRTETMEEEEKSYRLAARKADPLDPAQKESEEPLEKKSRGPLNGAGLGVARKKRVKRLLKRDWKVLPGGLGMAIGMKRKAVGLLEKKKRKKKGL
ncbi:p21-activated protein kinase-interacting protein 1 [Suncus etruscus]|uniref:p21-activated protein kinase-interacting protein 1 n=1 Tax=Suncus etruscus TaxID=109475 RepID=UPI00210F7F56|nr:p21-activated protein kinase-interacting protein 1 [Suncus etruscus]